MFSPMDLQIDFDLGEYTTGKNMVDIKKIECPKTAYIYIPRLMQNISYGNPKKTVVKTKGLSIFKNIDGRPTVTGDTIKEKNYIISSHTINYSLAKNTVVRCSFLNSKISKLSFNKGDSSMYYG